jgi:hypothetical protein
MTDRELLERAAKAAGMNVLSHDKPWPDDAAGWFFNEHGQRGGMHNTERPQSWNPITDDGDALRLAVKLGLYIEGKFTAHQEVKEFVELGELAAVRRAIVRAAAAMVPA